MTGCDFGREIGQHRRWLAPDSRHVLDVGRTSDRDHSANIAFCGPTDHSHAGIF
jgi:hypothetical protein